MRNKHVLPVPPKVLDQVQTKIDEITELLAPYLLALTPDERHDLPKMGDKTLSFVEKAQEFAHHYPQLCPSYLDMDTFDMDMKDAVGLRTVHISSKQLSSSIDDTIKVAGSEAYQSALMFYNAVKAAAAQDVPGAKEVYSALKSRFPRLKRKRAE